MSELSPSIEAQALNQTEDALRELIQVGKNIGLSSGQLAMMLRAIADDLAPSILLPPHVTVQ